MSSGKILYIITLPELGGAQAHVLELIQGFRSSYDIHLATGAPGPLTERARKLGSTIHILPNLTRPIDPRADLRGVAECHALIQSLSPQLIHAHSTKAGLIGRVAARMSNRPLVFTAHGWGFTTGVPPARRGFVWACELLTMPLATRIICVSHYDWRLARRWLFGRRRALVTVHHGLPADAVSARPDQQPVNIIMTARFQHQKDQMLLLRAFATLDAPDTRLTFVGDGPDQSAAQALAHALGIAGRVRFLGSRTDVPDLLAHAQIFVLLSRYEGLPISILEAMRAGLPVIATDVGGVSEQVAHYQSGLLVPPGNVRAVAGALKLLIDHPELRHQMGQTARRKFLSEFTLESMLAHTAQVYHEVLAERSCS